MLISINIDFVKQPHSQSMNSNDTDKQLNLKTPGDVGSVSDFMRLHFRHFNARETLDAAEAFRQLIESGGKMLLAMAGAMSTAEIGISLAEMIRQGKVHAVSCTAANLEEDVFNLLAHQSYEVCRNYRDLSPVDEMRLRDAGMNRVTDTCIPENVIRHLEEHFMNACAELATAGSSKMPFEIFYQLFDQKVLEPHFQIPPENSWLLAAWQKNIPVYSPGFEDSTLGNIFTARVIDGTICSHSAVASGTQQMEHLVNWYLENDPQHDLGFFQIGGGIAGDFAICSVPLILQDLQRDIKYWQYFAQISDSTTSYGSYSGAVPNEKITWHKLDAQTPRFMINSDASIVAPLIFAYVLGE